MSWLNRRYIVVLLFGFSSGLPLVLIASTLQAWYTSAGIALMTIGILSLVGQPYVYKFMWAPLFDRFNPIPAFGRRRSWILLIQLVLVAALTVMAFLSPRDTPWLLATVALIVAFCSASQDIAIDAYRTDLLADKERGLGASLTTMGYYGAMLVAGALALILADHIGWSSTYLLMVILMLVEALVTVIFAPRPTEEAKAPTNLRQATIEPIVDFLRRRHAVLIIAFIISYKLCDALALALNTTFLLRGLGFSLTQVGIITKTVGLSAALIGSFVGGMVLSRIELYRALFAYLILQILSILPFALLAVVGRNEALMAAAVFGEQFCGSLSSVGLLVLLMSLCNKRYTATQYALFSALASIGRVFVGPVAAFLVAQLGWAWFYVISALVGLPALVLLIGLQKNCQLFIERKSVAINIKFKSVTS